MSFPFSFWKNISSYDIDALEFITNHEIATGQPMDVIQKTAINNRYLRYKGIDTPNNSDLWTLLQTVPNARIWIQCPINDTTTNADACLMEFITKTQQGNYVGFTALDFTPTGIAGDVGKYFQGVFAPSDYSQNSHSYFAYIRTPSSVANTSVFGSNLFTTTNIRMTWLIQRPTDYYIYSNAVSSGIGSLAIAENPPIGLIGFIRKDSSTIHGFANGTIYPDATKNSSSPSNFELYWWARNSGGVNAGACYEEICSIYQGLPKFNALELEDFNYIEQLYQQEIITIGRNV